MTLNVIDAILDKETLSGIFWDNRVVEGFYSMEYDDRYPERNIVTLHDKFHTEINGQMNAREILQPNWMILFQVGGSAAALHLATLSVSHIEDVRYQLEGIFNKSELTLNTRRTIVHGDNQTPVAVVTSTVTIPTEFLKIFATRGDNYRGSWEDPNTPSDPNAEITTFLDMHDDPRDKKVGD